MDAIKSLATLSFNAIKANWPNVVTSVSYEVRRMKRLLVEEQREDEMTKFLQECLHNNVVPKFLHGRMSKDQRVVRSQLCQTALKSLCEEIEKRIELSVKKHAVNKTEADKLVQSPRTHSRLILNLAQYFSSIEVTKIRCKFRNQLNSLITSKENYLITTFLINVLLLSLPLSLSLLSLSTVTFQ